jgi:hypothetical protein
MIISVEVIQSPHCPYNVELSVLLLYFVMWVWNDMFKDYVWFLRLWQCVTW